MLGLAREGLRLDERSQSKSALQRIKSSLDLSIPEMMTHQLETADVLWIFTQDCLRIFDIQASDHFTAGRTTASEVDHEYSLQTFVGEQRHGELRSRPAVMDGHGVSKGQT